MKFFDRFAKKIPTSSLFKAGEMSRTLRHIIDSRKYQNNYIGIAYPCSDQIYLDFDRNCLRYSEVDNACQIERGTNPNQKKSKVVDKPEVVLASCLDVALNDLTIVMENSKFQLNRFGLTFGNTVGIKTSEVMRFIKSLNPPIHVKSVQIHDQGDSGMLSILQYLQPGTLEEINIDYMHKINISQIVKTDQWKQAREVNVFRGPSVNFEDFLHLDRFNICVDSISLEDVILLRDVLSLSANFDYCSIESFLPISTDKIHKIGSLLGGITINDRLICRHPIPNYHEFLEFRIRADCICIERKF